MCGCVPRPRKMQPSSLRWLATPVSSKTGPFQPRTLTTLEASCRGAGDTIIVAAEATGVRVGAVWTFRHNPPLLVGVDGLSLPEITIAVPPPIRGKGVGGSLLDELIARCAGKYEALTLNVHQRNPATRLYQRKGFRVIGQGRGALGIAMRRELP
jgi:GNAT superfamily N-acetyltransferase